MNEQDLKLAISAFRRACPCRGLLRHLDGTTSTENCWDSDCDKHDYKCQDRICHRLRVFINILKEPKQYG